MQVPQTGCACHRRLRNIYRTQGQHSPHSCRRFPRHRLSKDGRKETQKWQGNAVCGVRTPVLRRLNFFPMNSALHLPFRTSERSSSNRNVGNSGRREYLSCRLGRWCIGMNWQPHNAPSRFAFRASVGLCSSVSSAPTIGSCVASNCAASPASPPASSRHLVISATRLAWSVKASSVAALARLGVGPADAASCEENLAVLRCGMVASPHLARAPSSAPLLDCSTSAEPACGGRGQRSPDGWA